MAVISDDGTKILNVYDSRTGTPFNTTIYPELPPGQQLGGVWFKNKSFIKNSYGQTVPLGGYSKRDYEFDASAIWFGAVHDGYHNEETGERTGTDNTEALNKGIDYLHSIGGGVLYLPHGVGNYLIKGKIVLKANVYLKGEQSIRHDAYSVFSELMASNDFSDTMMEAAYSSNGGRDVYSKLNNGSNARSQSSRISMLKFSGGSRDNKKLRRLNVYGAWSVEIDRCTFVATKFLTIYAQESNTLSVHDCSINGCFMLNSVRDSHIFRNEISGFGVSNGTIARTPLWVTGFRSIGNIITNNLIYNSSKNIARPEFTLSFTSSAATDEITTNTENIFPDLTPVVLTGVNLGNGLSENPTYWIKASGVNKFKLYKTIDDASLGRNPVNINSDGLGKVSCGRETNFLYNGDIADNLNRYFNAFVDNRVDQSYGTGVELRGISGLIFSAFIVTSGFGNTVGQAGLVIKDSSNNNYAGTLIDGNTYTGGLDGDTSNQTIGIIYNGKHDFSGVTVMNHAEVDFWNVGSSYTSNFTEFQSRYNTFKNVSGMKDLGNYIFTKQRNGTNVAQEWYNDGNLAATLVPSSDGINNTLAIVFQGLNPANAFIFGGALGGGWNSGHARWGRNHVWFDDNGNIRVKSTAPVSHTDGDSLMRAPVIDPATVAYTKDTLNTTYPNAKKGVIVVVKSVGHSYLKLDDSSTGQWWTISGVITV
jgi:hypothetical protein